jgi:CRP-like cAMP-binding protein
MKSLKSLLDDPEFSGLVPCVIESYKAGEVILEEDDEGRDFYLITEGEVHVRTYIEDKVGTKSTGLTKLVTDDLFGEISMFDGEPRSAQITAATDCTVIHFDGPSMIQYMDSHPEKGYPVLRDMFSRLIAHMRKSTIRSKTVLQMYFTEQAF